MNLYKESCHINDRAGKADKHAASPGTQVKHPKLYRSIRCNDNTNAIHTSVLGKIKYIHYMCVYTSVNYVRIYVQKTKKYLEMALLRSEGCLR